jgi:Pyruvate/2-oxoacid:ferredoxin oxidoreductase gamma subunit
MKTATTLSGAFAALFGAAVIVGCDEKVAEEKKVDVKRDGTVVTEKETVTKKSDGTIVEEKSRDVDKPDREVDQKDKDVDIKVDVDEK